MNKKKIGSIFLTICLTFSFVLFLINASPVITINDKDANRKISQLSKSDNKNESKIPDSKIQPLPNTPIEPETNLQSPINNEINTKKENVVSRGTSNRNTYYHPNPVTNDQATQNAFPKSDTQYDSNLDLLARLITAEAQGEPYDAKVAVGAVVINRLESGLWANTITDVIYQNIDGYYQFTPVKNGWINKPAESESIEAAKAALNGVDPTNGAQFYYDDTTTNEWLLSKTVSIQIGHLNYAY